jgi:hypothetical protein
MMRYPQPYVWDFARDVARNLGIPDSRVTMDERPVVDEETYRPIHRVRIDGVVVARALPERYQDRHAYHGDGWANELREVLAEIRAGWSEATDLA